MAGDGELVEVRVESQQELAVLTKSVLRVLRRGRRREALRGHLGEGGELVEHGAGDGEVVRVEGGEGDSLEVQH